MEISLILEKNNMSQVVPFTVNRMVNAGFTGKNQEEVKHHLDELAAKGIPVPESTPLLYPVIPNTLSTASEIEVYGEETSGEIEYVLFIKNDAEIYVGIGSDHTDRKLEENDIPRSKQITPNIISPLVWDLNDVADHWDSLNMECTVEKNQKKTLYQKGSLGLLMSPKELLEFVSQKVKGPLSNIVIFSGTVKMETDSFVFADAFSGKLVDPKRNRSIGFGYKIRPLDYMI